VARTVKNLLSNVETEIFYNWNDSLNSEIKAVNITLCNITGSAVDVWLSFCVISGMFSAGLVLSQTTVPANETISIEITNREILMDQSIRGFASVADAVSLSIDLVGDIESEQPIVPIPALPFT